MEEILIQNAQTFASQHQLQLAERLGFGIHGIIFVAEGKSAAGKTALKYTVPSSLISASARCTNG